MDVNMNNNQGPQAAISEEDFHYSQDVIRKLSKHLLRISRTSTRSRYQSLRKIQQSLVRQLRDFSRCVKLTRQSRTVL